VNPESKLSADNMIILDQNNCFIYDIVIQACIVGH